MFKVIQEFQDLCYELKNSAFIPTSFGTISIPTAEYNDIYDDSFDTYIYSVLCETCDKLYKKISCEHNQNALWEYRFLENEHKRTFSFFFLECKTAKTALILLRASIPTKIWINYKLYSVVSGDNKMLVINLNSGINTVVLECLDASMEYRVFVRVSNYQTEKEKNTFPCLFQGDMRYHENFGQTQHSGNHFNHSNLLFILIMTYWRNVKYCSYL